MTRNVAIIHYNTPELTEAAILSLRYHGGQDYNVFVFDNSDKRPFTKRMKRVKVWNNRKGQIINFDEELKKYPERDEDLGTDKGYYFGSDKHMMSVQKLWELIPDGFVLMDSDILIKQDIDFMFMENECVVGHISKCCGPYEYERLAPMLLWINVPMCKAGGARFFDPDRAWALHKGLDDKRNCWDTGGALLDDIRRLKPQCHGIRIDIRPLMEHYGGGSWHQADINKQKAWLDKYEELWKPSAMRKQYTVLTYIFNNYEDVHEIKEKDPLAEYVLVTDDPGLKSDTWRIYYDGSLLNLSPFDKCYQVRFHPFRYAKTDIVVRIDGSIEVRKPLGELVDPFKSSNAGRCMMLHPTRHTMPEEYKAWVDKRNYPKEQAEKCLAFMKRLGYDMDTECMYEGGFEIQRNSATNTLINDMVFDYLRYLGNDGVIERVDQTVTSFVIKHFFPEFPIMEVEESVIHGGLMKIMPHKKG